jgi:hypothetical protein
MYHRRYIVLVIDSVAKYNTKTLNHKECPLLCTGVKFDERKRLQA